jgi:hypothetical protein
MDPQCTVSALACRTIVTISSVVFFRANFRDHAHKRFLEFHNEGDRLALILRKSRPFLLFATNANVGSLRKTRNGANRRSMVPREFL